MPDIQQIYKENYKKGKYFYFVIIFIFDGPENLNKKVMRFTYEQ